MTEQDYIDAIARVMALPTDEKDLLLSTEDKYFVMLEEPYTCFVYKENGHNTHTYFDKEAAFRVAKEIQDKVGYQSFKYGVYKLSKEIKA